MKTSGIIHALNYIDDDLVSGAVTYNRRKRMWRKNIAAYAAAAAIVIAFATILFWNNCPGRLPFTLTAYAEGMDHNVSAAEMKERICLPVSMFQADNGLRGFVFSYSMAGLERMNSVAIINADELFNGEEAIETINGIEMDDSRKYVFYVPPQNEDGPYRVSFPVDGKDGNTVAMLTLLIEHAEEGYSAQIERVESHPRRETPQT